MHKINSLIAACILLTATTAFDSMPISTPNKMSETINIGLDALSRSSMVEQLTTLLADEYVLYTKTLNYHWNVKGLMFNDLHLFFRKQYEELFTFIDAIAERIQALGRRTPGTLAEFTEYTTLTEKTVLDSNHVTMLSNLLHDHEVIIREIRDSITLSAELKDYGTENFLADLLEKHEKMAWMLRSYLS